MRRRRPGPRSTWAAARPAWAFGLALGLALCLVLAGSWGAFHRTAHAVPVVAAAPGSSAGALSGSLSGSLPDGASASGATVLTADSGAARLAGHHDAGSGECRWLDQLAHADGLWAALPQAAAAAPQMPVPCLRRATRAQAPSHGWQARGPPRAGAGLPTPNLTGA